MHRELEKAQPGIIEHYRDLIRDQGGTTECQAYLEFESIYNAKMEFCLSSSCRFLLTAADLIDDDSFLISNQLFIYCIQ